MKHSIAKHIEYSKNSVRREVYKDKHLYQKGRKISNTQCSITPKGARKKNKLRPNSAWKRKKGRKGGRVRERERKKGRKKGREKEELHSNSGLTTY